MTMLSVQADCKVCCFGFVLCLVYGVTILDMYVVIEPGQVLQMVVCLGTHKTALLVCAGTGHAGLLWTCSAHAVAYQVVVHHG